MEDSSSAFSASAPDPSQQAPSSTIPSSRSSRLKNNLVEWVSLAYSLLIVITKRVRHNLGLSISAIIGIVAVMAIVVAVPVFSYAISSEVLRQQLEEMAALTNRDLFSLHTYNVDISGSMTVDKFDQVTQFIRERFPSLTSLNINELINELQTPMFDWISVEPRGDAKSTEAWMNMGLFSLEELPQHAELLEGSWPTAASDPNDPVQVAVLDQTADENFLNVGDRFKNEDLEIEVAGIWRPKETAGSIWYDPPYTAYLNKFWVSREIYRQQVAPKLDKPVFYASWYMNAKNEDIEFPRAPEYARGLVRLDSETRQLVPGIKTDYTPLEALDEYIKRSQALTNLIYAVSGPMVIMALLFIGLTATISVQQYAQETATMRGRGTSWSQVAGLNLLESGILILFSIPIALIFGWLAANLMGKTLSFLRFTSRGGIPFSFDSLSLGWILIAALLIIAARFLPMFDISRTTIVRIKQEQTRATSRPIWQRFYLDFLLLVPGIYNYIVLGGIFEPAGSLPSLAKGAAVPYQDPLLFVAPSLFAIGLCMIFLRILPKIIYWISKIIDRLPGVWAYLSIQQISRRPQDHTNALLLIMISLALSIYSASTAKTLDKWQYDSIYHASGADLAVHEFVLEGGDNTSFNTGQASPVTLSELDLNVEEYVSMEDHLKLPSIQAVTRVGKYYGDFSYGVGEENAIVMGIERLGFPQVAFYREDYADQSLGGLLNALGAQPDGMLVPRSLAQEKNLQIGDRLMLSINIMEQTVDKEVVIAGFYDLFPTVSPSDEPTLIVDLESIFDNPESVIGYDIWMRLRPDTQKNILLHQLRKLIDERRAVVDVRGNGLFAYQKSLDLPERVGVFGVLNVGFLVTGLMPGIGFVLYSYASLRRRFIQLGILQAIGMSVKQLVGYLTLEQLLLMGLAIFSGAAIGILTSYMFVPLLQVNTGAGVIPPFQVLIGWGEAIGLSLVFGLVLVLTILGTVYYLVRMKVFQAVKMGESL